ncbi:MAG: hypothetical protein ACOZNI_36510 [Myxococcota bacterium]
MRAIRLAVLQARGIAGDPYGLLGALGLTVAFSGCVALRFEGSEEIARLMSAVYAVSGLTTGFLAAAGGRVPRAVTGVAMPTLPMTRVERALTCVLLGYAMLAVAIGAGEALRGHASVAPFAPHVARMALYLLPGLVHGPRAGDDLFSRIPVLAFLVGTCAYAWAGGLLTVAGAAIWAAIATAILHLPLPTIPLPAFRDRSRLGRAGTSPALAIARFHLGRSAIHGAILGPLLFATGLLVRWLGIGDLVEAPLIVGPIVGAILPAWPHGWPRPFLGHAAALTRLPVSRGVGVAGMLAAWAITLAAATASVLGTWALARRPLGLDVLADRPLPIVAAVLAGLVFRLVCAGPLLRGPRPLANRPGAR